MDWKSKLAAAIILLGLGVWIGMSGATDGMENIHGPFSRPVPAGDQLMQEGAKSSHDRSSEADTLAEAVQAESSGIESLESLLSQSEREPWEVKQIWESEPQQSIMEQAADKTGVLVQRTAQKSLEVFISWFESATD